MKRTLCLVAVLLLFCATVRAQPRSASDAKLPSVSEKVAGMQRFAGYFPFYWDAKAGKIWLEIDKWNSEFLYVESLPAGIGSNDIGLDRGQLGQNYIVRFERIGPKVLLIASNQRCGDLKSRPNMAIVRSWTRRLFICGMSTESPARCNVVSRDSSASTEHAALSISVTRRTFPGTRKLKLL